MFVLQIQYNSLLLLELTIKLRTLCHIEGK